MNKNKRTASNLFGCAGTLMTISGILMVVSGRVAIGGVFWASANCMFLTARHFAKAKEKTSVEENSSSQALRNEEKE